MDQIDLPQTEAQAAEQMVNRYPPLFVETSRVDQYGDPEEDEPEEEEVAGTAADASINSNPPADYGRPRIDLWEQSVIEQLRDPAFAPE